MSAHPNHRTSSEQLTCLACLGAARAASTPEADREDAVHRLAVEFGKAGFFAPTAEMWFLENQARMMLSRVLGGEAAFRGTQVEGGERLDLVFAEMAERGWLALPDGHGPGTVRDVFLEAYGRYGAALSSPLPEDPATEGAKTP